jgi:hypothetical protein
MLPKEAVLGVFAYTDDLVDGVRRVRQKGYEVAHVFSPVRIEEIDAIRGRHGSPVPFLTLIGGVLGGVMLVTLAVHSHLSFKLITGAKPILPVVPWVIVCFEGIILLSVVFSVVTWILKGRLPRFRPPVGYDPRFSDDLFGALVLCTGMTRGDISDLLTDAGAMEVRHVSW